MKTKFLTLATAALLLAACSGQDDLTGNVQQPTTAAEEDMPIGFDTYISSNSQGQTRAVYTVGTTTGQFNAADLTDSGFGIFAYLKDAAITISDETDADATKHFTGTPDFMYDQKVTYAEATGWTYTPLKYWPNMTTNDNRTGNGATMSSAKYVNFFAYAPYIPTKPVSGAVEGNHYLNPSDGKVQAYSSSSYSDVTTGIMEIVANDDAAAPTITYKVASDASQCTDLLWATAPLGGLHFASVSNATYNKVDAGKPLINLLKPETQTKLKFSFQHALTAMKMSIQLAVDQVEGGGKLDSNTKVYVDSIKLTSSKKGDATPIGFATEGKLNLLNTAAFTPRWETTGTAKTWNGDLTISASGNVTINPAIRKKIGEEPASSGVTTTAQGVFASDVNKTLMFIPVFSKAGDLPVTVTITYKVVTTDTNYASETVVTTNTISNSVVLKNYKAGRLYNLKLVLGLTSVKIDAEAQDWAVEESTVELPRNLE